MVDDHTVADGGKFALDIISATVAVGTLASFLPPLAALLTIVWTLIRIWETETVRGWTGRLKARKEADSQDEDD